jgi:hypothetical protein
MQPDESRFSFAKRIGVPSLVDLERGASLRWDSAKRIGEILGVTPGWLIDGTGPKTIEEAEAVECFLRDYREARDSNPGGA